MSDLPLGKIIDEGQQRDAIHIAVAPVIAAERLVPGGHIGFAGDDTEHVSARAKVLLGVVDPFLMNIVEHGQRFWMFLYPQTITSLRHDWTHPAFEAAALTPAVPDKTASEKWLREYADIAGFSLERLLESAENRLGGDYGFNIHTDIPNRAYDLLPEFWQHYEIVTGVAVNAEAREDLPFHCSC